MAMHETRSGQGPRPLSGDFDRFRKYLEGMVKRKSQFVRRYNEDVVGRAIAEGRLSLSKIYSPAEARKLVEVYCFVIPQSGAREPSASEPGHLLPVLAPVHLCDWVTNVEVTGKVLGYQLNPRLGEVPFNRRLL